MVSLKLSFPIMESVDRGEHWYDRKRGILSLQNSKVYFCGENTNFYSFLE